MKKFFIIATILLLVLSISYVKFTEAQEVVPPGPPGEGPQDNFGPPPPGPPGMPFSGDHPPGPPPELTEDQIAKMMEFAKEYFPTFYSHSQEIKDINPEEYKKLILERFPMIMELLGLKGKEPELFNVVVKNIEMEDKSGYLSMKYIESSDETEKANIERELKTLLAELFPLKQKEEKIKADKMEEEVKKIRELIEQREANKDTIIQDRLNELTGKNQYLKW